ncbi:twin-arginine translocase TatA/TatE family subunit [Gemmatimonadales bacterium]|jgi:sec-independent protein translocase protein TatA|nr:twin-arginine translocase TatA/TatE family subunit [Gemmatimonadales bacterium]
MNGILSGLGLITFGVTEAILVFGILMLLFGAKKLPSLARGLGSGIRNFKGELQAPPEDQDDGPHDA